MPIFCVSLARVLGVVSVAVIAAYGAQEMGLPGVGVLAGLGVGGIAGALAAQSSIENLIGALNVYADRPIRVGDLCDSAGIQGCVEHIGLRSTRIRALDRTVTSVPNSALAKFTSPTMLYETTTGQLREVPNSITGFLLKHPAVLQDVAVPRLRIVGFGDWSIKVEVYAYVDATEVPKFLVIQEELAIAIINLVRAAGADFAFPSQTTYLARGAPLPT